MIPARWRNSNKQSVFGRGSPIIPSHQRWEHPRGPKALPGVHFDTSPNKPTDTLLPSSTPILGDLLFPTGVAFWGATSCYFLPSKPQALLIDEWALEMIDLFDSMKCGDYLVLVGFPKCVSCRHRTFVPLRSLTPLLVTNLCKDLAWPV